MVCYKTSRFLLLLCKFSRLANVLCTHGDSKVALCRVEDNIVCQWQNNISQKLKPGKLYSIGQATDRPTSRAFVGENRVSFELGREETDRRTDKVQVSLRVGLSRQNHSKRVQMTNQSTSVQGMFPRLPSQSINLDSQIGGHMFQLN